MGDPLEKLLALLDSSGPHLHALLTRLTLREHVAEDLMQELFLKLRRSRAFDRATNPAAYAFRAAINLAFDWRRAEARRLESDSLTTEPATNPTHPLTTLIQTEELERILNTAAKLPEQCRDAFVMRHIQQESYETVAERLGKTPHQARGLCHKAITLLRTHVGADSPAPPGKEVPRGES